jgi:tRNA threonylcarbamoyladenosine biosynthesis protein TsaE
MPEKQFYSENPTQLNSLSDYICSLLETNPVATFIGEPGAGKTTLIQAVCKTLGVIEPVNSPTFSLVNAYQKSNGKSVYHFDWYRIASAEELLDIGIFEYLDSGDICLIEWPSRAEILLQDLPILQVEITHSPPGRTYRVSIPA